MEEYNLVPPFEERANFITAQRHLTTLSAIVDRLMSKIASLQGNAPLNATQCSIHAMEALSYLAASLRYYTYALSADEMPAYRKEATAHLPIILKCVEESLQQAQQTYTALEQPLATSPRGTRSSHIIIGTNRLDRIEREKASINERSVSAEIAHDQQVIKAMLDRPQAIKQAYDLTFTGSGRYDMHTRGKTLYYDEKKRADVLTRVLLTIGAGNLQLKHAPTDQAGATCSAYQSGLPTASFLTHGGYLLITIPRDTGDTMFNWLTQGNPSAFSFPPSLLSQKKTICTGEMAQNARSVFYNRKPMDYTVSIKKDGTVREKKLSPIKKAFFTI
jgi:hypothetical protein